MRFYNTPGELVEGDGVARRKQGVRTAVAEESTGTGSFKYSPAYGQAVAGKTVTVTAAPAKGSVFAYWLKDGEVVSYSTAYKAVMGDGDYTGLTAVFRKTSDFKTKPPAPSAVDVSVFDNLRVGVAFKAQVTVPDEYRPVKFTAKNLPAGLKLNATTGVISGVPTQAGKKTISITATCTANTKLVSPALKIAVNVAKLDGWAKGTFKGKGDFDNLSKAANATMTVGATGKISGKFTVGKKSYSFTAASFASDYYAATGKLTYGKVTYPVDIFVEKDETTGKGTATVFVKADEEHIFAFAELTK